MNNNNLLSSNQNSRQNLSCLNNNKNITNITVKNSYEDNSKRSYSLSSKYEYRPNTNISNSNTNIHVNKPNDEFFNKKIEKGENYRYRDLRINEEQKFYDKSNLYYNSDGNFNNISNKAPNRFNSLNKNNKDEEYKQRTKNMGKSSPANNLIIKSDLNSNKLVRSSNFPLQMSLNNPNNNSPSKNIPQINRSLIVNKIDSSFNKEAIKDRYSHLYALN